MNVWGFLAAKRKIVYLGEGLKNFFHPPKIFSFSHSHLIANGKGENSLFTGAFLAPSFPPLCLRQKNKIPLNADWFILFLVFNFHFYTWGGGGSGGVTIFFFSLMEGAGFFFVLRARFIDLQNCYVKKS